jgi:cysteine synthase A
MLQQFENEANPAVHGQTTAREILEATDNRVDAFVAGVGTGGTITGVGRVLRQVLGQVRLVAVEPSRSQALGGGAVHRHGIEGIGAGFVPRVLDTDLIDEVLACDDEDALRTSAALAAREGINAGISGGAAVWGALQVAVRLGPGRGHADPRCVGSLRRRLRAASTRSARVDDLTLRLPRIPAPELRP